MRSRPLLPPAPSEPPLLHISGCILDRNRETEKKKYSQTRKQKCITFISINECVYTHFIYTHTVVCIKMCHTWSSINIFEPTFMLLETQFAE